MKLFRLTLLLVVLLIASPLLGVDSPTVVVLLEKLPAATLADEAAISKVLINLRPAALKETAALVIPLGTGDDTKARYALGGLTKYVIREGAETERVAYSGVLLNALAAAKNVEVQTFFLHELQSCGKDEAVTPIAAMLGDASLCEPATQALCGIHTPTACAAIAAALPSASGANRITLAKACGYLRVTSATDELLNIARNFDTTLRMTALYSLANIGVPQSAQLLKKATEVQSVLERAGATSRYLLLARRLAEAGHTSDAAVICRDVVQSRLAPDEANVRSAALSSLLAAVGPAALPDLLAAANTSDVEQRIAALNLAQSIPGKAATARWVQLMSESPVADVRADVANMLARRGDISALPGLLALLKDDESAPLRLAVIPATAKLGGDASIPALLVILVGDDAALSKAAGESLARLKGNAVVSAAGGALHSAATPAAKIALLNLLGVRATGGQSASILQMTAGGDRTIRTAAFKAMETTGRANDQAILLAMATGPDEAQREHALQAAVACALWTTDPTKRADAVVEAIKPLTGELRAMFIRVLPKLATKGALDTVVAETVSSDAVVKEAAIRTLAAWPDADATGALLNVAGSNSNVTLHVVALRGAIDLTRNNPTGDPSARATRYAESLAIAQRVEEKRLVLSALAAERSNAALAVAARVMDDPVLKADAALAVIKMATPLKNGGAGLRGTDVVTALEKAAELVTDAHFREQAQAYLKRIK